MTAIKLSVREMQVSDIDLITRYWLQSDHHFLKGMGVDVSKIPLKEDLQKMLTNQFQLPVEQRRSYCIIWEADGKPVGHCNTNPTHFGDYAYMHLHLWQPTERKKGMGLQLVKLTLPYFFEKLHLKQLYCEPYALNPAPNKTIPKAGFHLVKEYTTTPGALNFEQPVKQWLLTREKFNQLYSNAH